MNAVRVRAVWALGAAGVCLATGVLLERSIVERFIVRDGELESYFFQALLFLGQLVCVAIAGWLFHHRENRESVGMASAVFIGACTVTAGIVGLEILLHGSDAISGWRSSSAKSEQNVLGFRGQPIEYSSEDFVIILLGDSQVEAKACAYDWMPERRLQHFLGAKGKRVKVFTVGAAGYGQDQEFLALQGYLSRFRADLVVVWLTPGNDVNDNLWPTVYRGKSRYLKPTFRLEGGKLIGPTEQIGESVALSRSAVLSRVRQLGEGGRDHSFENGYPDPYTPRDQYDGPVVRRTYPYGMSGAFNEGVLRVDRSGLSLFLTPRSPRITYALDLMRQILTEMERTVSQQQGRLALFTAGPIDEMSVIVQGTEVLEVAGKYYEISSEQGLANLEYITRGFSYIHSSVTQPSWAVGPDDGHLNEHAVDEAMANLADQLNSRVPAVRIPPANEGNNLSSHGS